MYILAKDFALDGGQCLLGEQARLDFTTIKRI
jgi:hypothetical protein